MRQGVQEQLSLRPALHKAQQGEEVQVPHLRPLDLDEAHLRDAHKGARGPNQVQMRILQQVLHRGQSRCGAQVLPHRRNPVPMRHLRKKLHVLTLARFAPPNEPSGGHFRHPSAHIHLRHLQQDVHQVQQLHEAQHAQTSESGGASVRRLRQEVVQLGAAQVPPAHAHRLQAVQLRRLRENVH